MLFMLGWFLLFLLFMTLLWSAFFCVSFSVNQITIYRGSFAQGVKVHSQQATGVSHNLCAFAHNYERNRVWINLLHTQGLVLQILWTISGPLNPSPIIKRDVKRYVSLSHKKSQRSTESWITKTSVHKCKLTRQKFRGNTVGYPFIQLTKSRQDSYQNPSTQMHSAFAHTKFCIHTLQTFRGNTVGYPIIRLE